MYQICSTLNRGRPAAPLVLRIVIGGLFIWHGIDKFDVGINDRRDVDHVGCAGPRAHRAA